MYISINSRNSTVDCPGCLEITSLLANLDFVHVTLRAVPKADPFGGLHHVAVAEGEI